MECSVSRGVLVHVHCFEWFCWTNLEIWLSLLGFVFGWGLHKVQYLSYVEHKFIIRCFSGFEIAFTESPSADLCSLSVSLLYSFRSIYMSLLSCQSKYNIFKSFTQSSGHSPSWMKSLQDDHVYVYRYYTKWKNSVLGNCIWGKFKCSIYNVHEILDSTSSHFLKWQEKFRVVILTVVSLFLTSWSTFSLCYI